MHLIWTKKGTIAVSPAGQYDLSWSAIEPNPVTVATGVLYPTFGPLYSALYTNVGYKRTPANYDFSDPLVLTFVKVPVKDMIRMSEPDH